MFTKPAASPTSTGSGNLAISPVAANPASSTPTTRSSRLRGLSYLRNYTQTHLLSRDHGSHGSHGTAQPASPTPSPSTATTNPWFGAARKERESPAGTASDSHSNPSPLSRGNRLSQLVPTLAHPLGLSTSFSEGKGHTSGPTAGAASGNHSSESSAFPSLNDPDTPDRTADAARPIPPTDNMARARSATTGDAVSGSLDSLPSIRFSTFYDPRATRPSLKFAPISRTLPTGREVIRVGRYSERDTQPNVPANAPSAAPVGFKSKVVSRRHCEFWYEDGKWYIKDVKSSSGTFLNHIRLSPPGTESKPYPVNDGDIVQLGIDFKGGEEMIFRCVKMRLELNRGWQNKLNNFNLATHKRLRNLTTGSANNNTSGSYSQDCSICLNSIAPCQSLFVAPCSHTWHYKCIRSLLSAPSYPIFICPNCRAAADLEAEVEDPEEWEQLDSDEGAAPQDGALLQPPPADPSNPSGAVPSSAPRRSRESARSARFTQPPQPNEVPEVDMLLEPEPAQQASSSPQLGGTATALPDPTVLSHTMSNPMPIPAQRSILPGDGRRETRTPSPTGAPVTNGHEGPITPRNDAGPWVFDGSGLRLGVGGGTAVTAGDNNTASHPSRLSSLESAVQAAGARLQRDGDDIS
ncbi:uncharacterized protein B0T15DRAFT_496770 [Chaetomium strumarium]|uniref:RING-type E3 ubiquitin transferase n=1 Tax=Chaetomium strumarium TaxID=1170767 RepID=A0AAJ0LYG2_9PEZI|nr:hypothetical protein B0T15DRAFT_496770 [Chaetomium strumarium]